MRADCRLRGDVLMKYEKLTNENITAVSEQLYADLTSLGYKQKTAAAWRRAAEKIMRDYQTRFGSDTEFAYATAQHFGSVKASLQFRCASFNPFLAGDNSLSGLNKLLSIHDTVPVWKWSGGENCVTVTAKKTAQRLRHCKNVRLCCRCDALRLAVCVSARFSAKLY